MQLGMNSLTRKFINKQKHVRADGNEGSLNKLV